MKNKIFLIVFGILTVVGYLIGGFIGGALAGFSCAVLFFVIVGKHAYEQSQLRVKKIIDEYKRDNQ